jgi:lipopolysaccharide transport system ATP-binding protein
MGTTIIQAEHLSKRYRLGTIGTGSLRQDLTQWWNHSVLKKTPQQFFPDAEMNGKSGHIWALKNVSFEINEGEALGIIGSNGSGKSTLLKIISRITKPTTGTVRGRGKISSLLEVGTGFHGELTGRENIYISGSILGMRKAEINQKFDEIVAFSGVEQFIDTPVKRYSSGMYVRLAFAVAAHLEPDILIVDEVLAVGDAEFQKKCLGKMRDVSQKSGRTILFVSHNMQAVSNLCDKAMWLQKGKMVELGDSREVVNRYLVGVQQTKTEKVWDTPETAPGNDRIRVRSVSLTPERLHPDAPVDIRTPLTVKFQFWNYVPDANLSASIVVFSFSGECIFDLPSASIKCKEGLVEGECAIPGNFFNDGSYYIDIVFTKDTSIPLFKLEECLTFDLDDYRGDIQWFGKWWGAVRPKFPFHLKQERLIPQT